MKLKLALYNVQWMRDLFKRDGSLRTNAEDAKRSKRLAKVITTIGPDFLGIVEGPDTLSDGSKTASQQLERWIQVLGLNPAYKAVHGYPSHGQQELCAIYDSSKIQVEFSPTTSGSNQFNKPFLMDTSNRLIREQFVHYRPPLELTIKDLMGEELTRVIIAHTKSKGIFTAVDYARFEQISERDRVRLFAECMSIRARCDEHLNDGKNVVVMGDINDGAGMDFYESRFKKSALEILLGDVWQADKILRSVIDRPAWGKYGWKPSTSRYKDRITEDTVNVLIDHILVSKGVKVDSAKVWNPFEQKDDSVIQGLYKDLKYASDHYPVCADIELQ
ncbi:MAG: hypothetical protein JJ975_12200 [Bacteroidia bacterium]|nr:hypothetical protein [Bacteroidia bacterium]